MRIAVFFPSGESLGGAERRLSRIFSELVKQYDFNCDIVVLTKREKWDICEKFSAFTFHRVNIVTCKTNISVFRHFVKETYDWICYTDCRYRTLPVIFGGFFSKQKRLMLVVNTRNSLFTDKNILNKLVYRWTVLLSTRIDSLYPRNKKILEKKFPKKTISLTPGSFTNTERFCPAPHKEKNIVFSGRLIPAKGAVMFAKAIAGVSEEMRRNGYKCIVCGDGKDREEIENIFSGGNCMDLVEMKGNIADTSSIMSVSRIFCSLQPFGNYPSQALLEALSCGQYCIVTDTGDSYLMVDSPFGTLIKQDTQELERALVKAMNFTQKEYEAIQSSAQEFVKKNYTLEKSVNHFKTIFTEL